MNRKYNILLIWVSCGIKTEFSRFRFLHTLSTKEFADNMFPPFVCPFFNMLLLNGDGLFEDWNCIFAAISPIALVAVEVFDDEFDIELLLRYELSVCSRFKTCKWVMVVGFLGSSS